MEIPTINKQSLMKMKVGDYVRVNDPDTLLREVLSVPNGFIYVFQLQHEIHTQFVEINSEDTLDLREFFNE